MTRRPATGLPGIVALALGLRDLSTVQLLSLANVAAAQGRWLLAEAALGEMARRAA